MNKDLDMIEDIEVLIRGKWYKPNTNFKEHFGFYKSYINTFFSFKVHSVSRSNTYKYKHFIVIIKKKSFLLPFIKRFQSSAFIRQKREGIF